MKTTTAVPALIVLALSMGVLVLLPGSASGQVTFEFCRDASASDWACVGPSNVFPTSIPSVWVIIRNPRPGPYEYRIEWIFPSGSTYKSQQGRVPDAKVYRFRSSISVLGSQAETLPGEWLVRYIVSGTEIATGKFMLQLVGAQKFWVEALGAVSVDSAGLARRFENNQYLEIGAQFRIGERPYFFVNLSYPPAKTDLTLRRIVKWTAPSGETLESTAPIAIKQRGTNWRTRHQMPEFDGKVQQPVGNWQVECALEGTVLAKLQFTMVP